MFLFSHRLLIAQIVVPAPRISKPVALKLHEGKLTMGCELVTTTLATSLQSTTQLLTRSKTTGGKSCLRN